VNPGNAIVTGGAKRIGRTIAEALAHQGWSVAIHCNESCDAAQETAKVCQRLGSPRASVVSADLTDRESCDALIEAAALALGGKLSLLVNSASAFLPDRYAEPDANTGWHNLAVDLLAPLLLTQHFALQAPKSTRHANDEHVAGSCIINLVDATALRPSRGFASYTLAKSALIALTRNAALDLAPDIRVNAIAPGPTLPGSRESEAHFTGLRIASPLRNGASLQEITDTTLHILRCGSMTGEILCLDGGIHLAALI